MHSWCTFNDGSWLAWKVNKEFELEVEIVVENMHEGKIRLDREEALKLHSYLEKILLGEEIN